MAAKGKSNELKLTRVLNAPLSAVWDAWTDPAQIVQWWGPRGFTLTTHAKELRTGGFWNYTMHGPDGTDYHNITRYLDVVPKTKLVYDHGATETTPPLFRVTVTFSESKGKTRMDLTMALPSPEAAEETRKFIKKAGGDGTWDRLAEHVEKREHGSEVFVINRVFAAPINTLFDMWTKPEHVARWLPPTGAAMQFLRADIRPGGGTFYSMTTAQGVVMYGRAEYLKMERPELIVYTQQFCDKDEKLSRHPMLPTWPATMLTTIQLTEEDSGFTRVTVRWEPLGAATSEEIAAFVRARAGMSQGWTGSFDKLEDLLG